MSPSFAFVVPVLNEASGIAELLERLARDFPAARRIVVDGGSTDATVARAMPYCEELLLEEPGRARQMNLGGRVCDADYLIFLHADSCPAFDAATMARALEDSPPWGFCPVRLSGDHWLLRWVERGINWRSRLTRVATGDQMLFLRRDVFAGQHGFADIPLMEDVELSKRLRRLAAPRVLSQPVLTSSRRWERRGILRTVVQMWAFRLAYACGVSPTTLWRLYYG